MITCMTQILFIFMFTNIFFAILNTRAQMTLADITLALNLAG